jgi:GNAT superfamily N-acetyltransferase
MTAADIPAGLRLCRAARWNQLEEDWRLFVEPPSAAWLIEREGVVIGTSALARYDNLAWVAMMLVDPSERRSGHGARLLQAGLDAAAGAPCVGLDATPLGEPLYRKFGFVESYSLMRMTWGRFPTCPPAAGQVGNLPHLPAILSIDRDVFGADRSRLLTSLLQRAPESAWSIEDRGYCFGRPGHLYHQLGPVVANDDDTASLLVSHALAAHPCTMDVPLARLAWAKSLGFTEERPFVRMFLRGHKHPGDPSRQYAIAGPEFA